MDSIASLTSQTLTVPSTPTSQPSATGSQAMGQDVFLKLLVTQLQNQNPLNPMDNETFIGQLAQFSQLEQTNQLVSLMQQSVAQQQTAQQTGLVPLIGRQVQVDGSTVQLGAPPATVTYTLSDDAAAVKVAILDQAGTLIRTLTAGPQSAGSQSLLWDGLDQNGQAMSPGTYAVAVSATGAGGQAVPVQTSTLATVSGVTTVNGQPMLQVGGQAVDLKTVQGIY